jgi:hypothetical protein
MSNLLDLSEKIEPMSVALFDAVSEAAWSLGLAFFVVGDGNGVRYRFHCVGKAKR